MPQQTVEHVPVSQILKETVDPLERVQQRTVEHVPVPQILKETVDAVTAEEIEVVKDSLTFLRIARRCVDFDPTGTLAADQRAKFEGRCRGVQNCATGAIFGKDF